jgi:hypothetical protein
MKNDSCCKTGSQYGLIWPSILISGGIILILNNFNIVPWEFWTEAFRFWPVIFILIGVNGLLCCSRGGRFLSLLITLLSILFIFVYCFSVVDRNFDRWLQNIYPFWKNIKRVIPKSQQNRLYYPEFRGRGRTFDCSPFDENCYRYFKD